jgi:hypothetical protein
MRDSWSIVEPSLPALSYTYSFGPGIANTLALVAEGGVILVSPPFQPKDTAFTELEKHGPVRALVAPNAYHHMGIGSWKARYPDAKIFAPAQSIKRVEKHTKLSGILPLSEMGAKLLGDKIEMVDMPHYKTGEVLVRWRVEGGWAWYVTDVMFNMPQLPKGLFGTIMKWTKSGPGLRRNAIGTTFMVKDKRSLFAWLVEQAEKTPPVMVVACHGDVAKLANPAADMRAAVS